MEWWYTAQNEEKFRNLYILIDQNIILLYYYNNLTIRYSRTFETLANVLCTVFVSTVRYKVELIEEMCSPIFPIPTARKKSDATSVRLTSVKLSASSVIEPVCIDPPPFRVSIAGANDRAPLSQRVPPGGPALEIGILLELSGTCITGGWAENGGSKVTFIRVSDAFS